jgi:hypothetical protein
VPGGTFSSIGAAMRQIKIDIRAKERKLHAAVKKAARSTRNVLIRSVPKAFGELAAGIHVVDEAPGTSSVVSSAPHAAAVEFGSRPHMPPVAPIIAWVKQRGMQGLTEHGRIRQAKTLREADQSARAIAQALKTWNVGSRRRGDLHTPVDAAEQLGWAIAMHIKKYGTKPHFYVGAAVPYAQLVLEMYVNKAMEDQDILTNLFGSGD